MFLAATSLDSSSLVGLRVLMVYFTYFQVHLLKCKQSLNFSQRVHICTGVFLKQLNSLLVNNGLGEVGKLNKEEELFLNSTLYRSYEDIK